MRRLPTIAFLVACAVGVARAQPWHACLEYNSVYYDIVSDSSSTTMKRYNGAALIDSQPYSPFHLPAAGTTTWDEGVAFAATMQTRNAWLNNEPTSRATWEHSANSDVWTIYSTVNGVPNQFEFTTAKCRPATTAAPNCWSALNAFGVYCTPDEDCCGYGSMSPKCVPKNSGKKCCTHYLAATVCNASQSCCGMYGTGASSYAFCCDAGSSCCQASSSNQGATCCPSGTTCCRASSIGVCCAADEVCNPSMNSCTKVATTSSAPTPVPGLNRGCISYNGWFYDLRSDNSGATLDRYQGSTFVNRQTFAAFNRPAAGTTAWGQGVEFASAMQSRNAWLNTEATSSASWFEDGSTGNDRFTFVTTVGGQPMQFVFATEACAGAPVPPTAAPTTTAAPTSPPATPAPGMNRGCISNNGWYYDLRSDAVGTTLDRYQGSTFVNRQTYAAFHRPAAGTTTWDEGVAFAATMQTRNAWLNTEQTSAASWFEDPSTGNDRFTFVTTVGGQPVQYVFATEACV